MNHSLIWSPLQFWFCLNVNVTAFTQFRLFKYPNDQQFRSQMLWESWTMVVCHRSPRLNHLKRLCFTPLSRFILQTTKRSAPWLTKGRIDPVSAPGKLSNPGYKSIFWLFYEVFSCNNFFYGLLLCWIGTLHSTYMNFQLYNFHQ